MTTSYRVMRDSDKTEVREMITAFYAEDTDMIAITDAKIDRTFREFSTHPEKGCIMVFEKQGKLVGYSILVTFWSNEWGGNILDVDELFVCPSERGKGVGSDFLRHLIATRPSDCVAIELGVTPHNDRARNLYEKLGFTLSQNARFSYEF